MGDKQVHVSTLKKGQQLNDELDGFRKTVKKKLDKFLCGSRSLSPAGSPTALADFVSTKTDFVNAKTALNAVTHEAKRLEEDSDVYAFNYPKRGLAVVINNEDFSGTKDFSNRPGSKNDAVALEDTFKKLGFELLVEHNLTADQIAYLLKEVSREYDHIHADCFVCVILSHGDQTWVEREYLRTLERRDLLFGVDGKAIPTKAVVEYFNDERCPQLQGKPRLFFFQACRGDGLDDGTEIEVGQSFRTQLTTSSASSSIRINSSNQSSAPFGFQSIPSTDSSRHIEETDSKPELAQDSQNDDLDALPWSRVRDLPISPAPLYKDCLVMYATPPGFLAWRRDTGSWFIQQLCAVLSSAKVRSGNITLLRALTQVSRNVAFDYKSETEDGSGMKEQPVIYSRLIKDVYLKSKIPRTTQNIFFAP